MADTEKILIVGAGTMGEGIAQSFAQNGFGVRLVDNDDGQIARALGQVRQNVRAVRRVRPHHRARRAGDRRASRAW